MGEDRRVIHRADCDGGPPGDGGIVKIVGSSGQFVVAVEVQVRRADQSVRQQRGIDCFLWPMMVIEFVPSPLI